MSTRSAGTRKQAAAGDPQLRIRVDLAPGCSVGPGKISLLEAIERDGSLSVAARSIGLSYRRAWNLLADLNRSFTQPVVTTAVGGTRGGGARVTVFGRSLISAFRALERGALRLAATRMRRFTPARNSPEPPAQRRRVSGRLASARKNP
jgi:molybdate transport system regulatory protein